MPFRQREPNLTEPRHAPCLRPSGHDPRLSNAALWPTLMLRIGAFRALIGSVTPASRVPPHGGAYLAGPGNRLLSDDIVTGPGTGDRALGISTPYAP